MAEVVQEIKREFTAEQYERLEEMREAVVVFPADVADFLAEKLAERAFERMQDRVEFKDPWSVDGMRQIAGSIVIENEKAQRLANDRTAELTRPFMEFVGGQLGRWEAYEIDGWDTDDRQYKPHREHARKAWEIVRDAAVSGSES